MNRSMERINESLTLILEKLETIEAEITGQKEDVRTYFETRDIKTDFDERLILRMHSLSTSIELLRDEVDELHVVTIALSREVDDE